MSINNDEKHRETENQKFTRAEKTEMVKKVLYELQESAKTDEKIKISSRIIQKELNDIRDKKRLANQQVPLKQDVMTPATIISILKELGYTSDNGYMKKSVKPIEDNPGYIRDTLKYAKIVKRNFEKNALLYKTKIGHEKIVEELLTELLENEIVGSFTGKGCVMFIAKTGCKKTVEAAINEYRGVEPKKEKETSSTENDDE